MADKAGGILATIKNLITRAKGLDIIYDNLSDATLAKQNTIEADTDVLQQELAQREVAHFDYVIVNDITGGDIVNISDKGVLTGIGCNLSAFTAESSINLVLIIDGVTFFGSTPFSYFKQVGDSFSMALNHRFDSSLDLHASINNDTKGIAKVFATYTTD